MAISNEERIARRKIVLKKYYDKNKDKIREYEKERYLKDKERIRNVQKIYNGTKEYLVVRKNWRDRNKLQTKAQWAISRAVSRKKIKRMPCEICGEINTQAHHDDYTKPLEVRWLCRLHHMEFHKKG